LRSCIRILEGAARIVRGSASFDRSQRDFSIAVGHFETVDHLRQRAGSRLVRRLVLAKDNPAKRIRAWLSDIDDDRLFSLGLTSEDVAALRFTANRPAEATITQGLDAPSEDSGTS
jgi:hypothetical protein